MGCGNAVKCWTLVYVVVFRSIFLVPSTFFPYHSIYRYVICGCSNKRHFLPRVGVCGSRRFRGHNSAHLFCTFVLFSCTPRRHNSTIMPLLYPKIFMPDASPRGDFLYEYHRLLCDGLLYFHDEWGFLSSVMKVLFEWCLHCKEHASFRVRFMHIII